jgi:hypothetical protein
MTELHRIKDEYYAFEDEEGRRYVPSNSHPGYVDFGNVSHMLLFQQSQYGSRYVDGLQSDYPNLGKGLVIHGTSDEYHGLAIHPDHVEEFVQRVQAYRASAYGWVMELGEDGYPHQRMATEEEVAQAELFLRSRQLPTKDEQIIE